MPFQIVFSLSWLLLALLIQATLGYCLACALQGVWAFSNRPELRLADFSCQAMAAAFGQPAGDRLVSGLVRGLWLCVGFGGLGLWILSTGQLVVSRRARRAHLAVLAARPFPRRRELEEVLAEVCQEAGLPLIRLALRDAGRPGGAAEAEAECFGLFHVERFIEISDGFADLPLDQARALLAHECAHHRLGHLFIRSFLLYLGRSSFAGDGFVFALQDSFGYEKKADRWAVRLLGGRAQSLEAYLERKVSMPSPVPALNLLAAPVAQKWRVAFWSFRSQYCGGGANSLYYWHPSVAERLQTLRESR